MISYHYAGFDGHQHHGSVSDGFIDRLFTESTREALMNNVIEIIEESYEIENKIDEEGK